MLRFGEKMHKAEWSEPGGRMSNFSWTDRMPGLVGRAGLEVSAQCPQAAASAQGGLLGLEGLAELPVCSLVSGH